MKQYLRGYQNKDPRTEEAKIQRKNTKNTKETKKAPMKKKNTKGL